MCKTLHSDLQGSGSCLKNGESVTEGNVCKGAQSLKTVFLKPYFLIFFYRFVIYYA